MAICGSDNQLELNSKLDLRALMSSNDRSGYPQGSFAWNYLTDEPRDHERRLVPLCSPEEYATALKDGPNKGSVDAVVDERANIL